MVVTAMNHFTILTDDLDATLIGDVASYDSWRFCKRHLP
jgi:hypothetical protein